MYSLYLLVYTVTLGECVQFISACIYCNSRGNVYSLYLLVNTVTLGECVQFISACIYCNSRGNVDSLYLLICTVILEGMCRVYICLYIL